MSKWSGTIGFLQTVESAPGVYTDSITEHSYYGDIFKITSRYQTVSKVNDDISLSMTLSIVSDPFARENFAHMRYATYHGNKWKITSVDPTEWPRIKLELGGLYNE